MVKVKGQREGGGTCRGRGRGFVSSSQWDPPQRVFDHTTLRNIHAHQPRVQPRTGREGRTLRCSLVDQTLSSIVFVQIFFDGGKCIKLLPLHRLKLRPQSQSGVKLRPLWALWELIGRCCDTLQFIPTDGCAVATETASLSLFCDWLTLGEGRSHLYKWAGLRCEWAGPRCEWAGLRCD